MRFNRSKEESQSRSIDVTNLDVDEKREMGSEIGELFSFGIPDGQLLKISGSTNLAPIDIAKFNISGYRCCTSLVNYADVVRIKACYLKGYWISTGQEEEDEQEGGEKR